MTDALLLARIESLDENLKRVDQSLERLKEWQSRVEQQDRVRTPLGEDLWQNLNRKVKLQFRNQRRSLSHLREQLVERTDPVNGDEKREGGEAPVPTLTVAAAWEEYAEVRADSERLFDECLEFIGGLAFRRTGLDHEHMCELADALILSCAREAYAEPWYFLTVPSLRNVVTKSRARLSRIRFPEWNVWTLPFTAYVLGHEVMDEQEVAPFISGRLEAWARQDVAEPHVTVLLAEIFGAYVMGPSFAHAAIRLRFDPSRAHWEDHEHVAESSRAQVVLRTLERMEGCGREVTWQNQVAALREQWDSALREARPAGSSPDERQSLNELVDEALDHFGVTLNPPAEYQHDNWLKALELYGGWRREAENSDKVDALATTPAKLATARDALNAAWLMRAEFPAKRTQIERAATIMCRALLLPDAEGPPEPGQAPILAT